MFTRRGAGNSTGRFSKRMVRGVALLFLLLSISGVLPVFAQNPTQPLEEQNIYMPLIPAYENVATPVPVATTAAGARVYGLVGTLEQPSGREYSYYLATANNGYYALAGQTPELDQQIGVLARSNEKPSVKVWGEVEPPDSAGEPPLIVVTGILATEATVPTPIAGSSVPVAVVKFNIVNLYGEYDPDKSNELLDALGLEKGADGFRTFADGTTIDLIIETQDTGTALDIIELVAENWNAIGLKTSIKAMTRDIYWPRAIGNEVMIATWGTDRGLVPMVDPVYQFPFDERSWMAPAYGVWYKTGGEQGEEPTDLFKEIMGLYDQYRTTVDPAQQVEIGKQIVRISTENLFVIETVGMQPALVIAKNNFRNVIMDQSFVSDWITMAPGTQDPSHYYFSDAE